MAVKYGFFLGCVAPLRYPGIEKSTREVFKHLGTSSSSWRAQAAAPPPV